MRRWFLSSALLVGTITVATSAPTADAAAVPVGFSDSLVAGFSRPTTVEWLPDGRIAVLEQGGRLRTAGPGQPFTTALDVPGLCSNGERGLLGLTPHPGYWSNGLVYLYTTRVAGGTCVNRVSRFTMVDGTIDPASEQPIIDNISSVNGNHNGGDLEIGADGYLYVAVGDAGRDPRGDSGSAGDNDAAQDLSLLNGKILRLTLDGAPAPGNPVGGAGTVACGSRGNGPSTPTTGCREIYAWGLRNPYRFAFDHDEGGFLVNDVGQGTYEEVTPGVAGNHGWPMREGPCTQGLTEPCEPTPAGLVPPVTAYGRSYGSYVTAGAFVPEGRWPDELAGAYLFADGGSGNIWVLPDGGDVDYDAPFATGAFGITDMAFGYDAGGRTVLYYVTVGGELRMIRPDSAPTAPLPTDAKIVPVTPFRAYDTSQVGGEPIGTWAGRMVAGTSRQIDLSPPAGTDAALVNLTLAGADGPGFVTLWATGDRPDTSTLNVDRAGGVVANAAIVPVADDGTVLADSSATGRLIVDVLAWVDSTGGSSDDGRFVATEPARLVDTRERAGAVLDSGSTNPYARSGTAPTFDLTIDLDGTVPAEASAAVVSITAISRSAEPGYVGAYPAGEPYTGTSNVNVLGREIRANLVVVPLGDDGDIALRTFHVADVAVDVLGHVTADGPTASSSGLFTGVDTTRIVDTRNGIGPLDRLTAGTTNRVSVPGGSAASAVVHNVTAVRTAGWGFLTLHPEAAVPEVSTVNYTGSDQQRASLAFTTLADDGSFRISPFSDTDVLVDVLGTFSR